MANRSLFGSGSQPQMTTNDAGGEAFGLSPEQALAQLAATGTLNHTYYATAEQQLNRVIVMANKCTPQYVAAVAVYARQKGFMKDMPALLLAHLTQRAAVDPAARVELTRAFRLVVDNGKMLRNYAQLVRSGQMGRKSFGTHPQRLIREWLAKRKPEQLFRDSVGESPSIADIIKMVHPRPSDDDRRKLYGYLIGKTPEAGKLPAVIERYEEYKHWKKMGAHTVQLKGDYGPSVPDVDFRMLDSLGLSDAEWAIVAERAPWQMTRMNINTFMRHNVFADERVTSVVAAKLANPELIRKARPFPYQLFTTYLNIEAGTPLPIIEALQQATEISTENVPQFGDGAVCVDISGSMHAPVTGHRKGSTSKTSCLHVASLIGAVMHRQGAMLLPFSDNIQLPRTDMRQWPILKLAQMLASLPSGGTACQLPLMALNEWDKRNMDYVLYVSDNESWIKTGSYYTGRHGTEMLRQWDKFKERNPKAKLILIDLVANTTTQAFSREDILNVGGFSDDVFNVVREFLYESGPDHWVNKIKMNYLAAQKESQ